MKKLFLALALLLSPLSAQAAYVEVTPAFYISSPDTIASFQALYCEDNLLVVDSATNITWKMKDCETTPGYDLVNSPTNYSLAAITISSNMLSLLQSANYATARTNLGLAAVANTGSYNDLTNQPTITSPKAYEGTSLHNGAFPIFKSATVSSGVAVFNFTADGTSTGTTLCTNGIIADSVNPIVSDATASYQMSWAFSNSNKTLTVTANKLTTANILTGILGQSAANSSAVKVTAWCY